MAVAMAGVVPCWDARFAADLVRLKRRMLAVVQLCRRRSLPGPEQASWGVVEEDVVGGRRGGLAVYKAGRASRGAGLLCRDGGGVGEQISKRVN